MFTTPMTPRAARVIGEAVDVAMENGDITVRPDHLLTLLLDDMSRTIVGDMLESFEHVTLSELKLAQSIWEAQELLPQPLDDVFVSSPAFDETFLTVVRKAEEVLSFGETHVDLEHLLLGVALEPLALAGRFLAIRGADHVRLRQRLIHLREERRDSLVIAELEYQLARV